MGDELGNATDIDRLLVSRGRSTQKFTLIGNEDFWSSHADVRRKCHQEMDILSLVGCFDEIEPDSKNVCGLPYPLRLCQGQCFQVSSPSSKWLTRYNF